MAKNATKYATVHGWDGQGKTLTEAKADAICKIAKAAEGYYAPVVIKHKDMLGLAWREPLGWWYKIIRPDDIADGKEAGPSCCGTFDSETEVRRAMIRHLCQNGHTPGGDPQPPAFMTNEEDRKDHARWASWQNAYRVHKNGNPNASDNECRAAADVAAFGWTLQPK